jgi:MoaA/NifB/PqqE/SkfB family radical SAM enzyme
MSSFFKLLNPRLALNGIPVLYKLYRDQFRVHGDLKDLGISIIDTTAKCNLDCKLCYYKRNRGDRDLDLESWIKILEKMRRTGTNFATWTGGEPLLRKDLINQGRSIFPFNSVFTNGTQPIPNWDDVVFYVSVDGTQKYYEDIRGTHYNLIKNNVKNSPISVNIAMVINKLNEKCLEDFCEEWIDEPNCSCIVFDFYTPGKNEIDELTLSNDDVEEIIKRLKSLNQKYKGKLLLSNKMLDLFHLENRSKVVGENCVVRRFKCLDNQAKVKSPCTMVKSDCDTCGHFIPHMFYSMFRRGDLDIIRLFLKYCIK